METADAPAAHDRSIDDCWNRIGVRGDGSCAQLACHIHCRNCEVYSAAAAQLRNGGLPPGQLAEWTGLVSRGTQAQAQRSGSALIFRIGAEWLALPTVLFEEIGAQRPIHSLPHRHNGAVLGVANIRGELIVCISLRHILGVEDSGPPPAAGAHAPFGRMLVVQRHGHRAVFPADEVHGIERYDPRELSEIPSTLSKGTAAYSRALLSWRDKSVGLLDEALLFQTLNRSLALATAT
ncbi:MAG: purine-binding chemotaxis protein CheW [Nevskia sp.]|nr:purine-binding chemotaxis protein CheW [Nevskia sp.]